MIKKNITKKILLITLCLFLYTININTVIAIGYMWSPNPYSDNDESQNACPPSGPGPVACPEDGLTATCWEKRSTSDWTYIDVDSWDKEGNYNDLDEAIAYNNQNTVLTHLAGTFVGLNVYEKKGYYIHVNTGAHGIQEYHDCQKYVPCSSEEWDPHTKEMVTINCSYWEYQTRVPGTTCPEGFESYSTYWDCATACTSAYQHCKDIARPSPKTIEKSYYVTYYNSNDIEKPTANEGRYETYETIMGTEISHTQNNHDGSWYWHLEEEKIFEYNRQKTCINVKTGEVRYINQNDNCENNEEINEIEITQSKSLNGTPYWKYFIPLNANSKDGFDLSVTGINEGKLDESICLNIMYKYPNYQKVIKPISGSFNGNKANDERTLSNGCMWQLSVTIPIEQKFYNELEDGQTFKGFNFYYKPIDINNPFPNNLSNTSLWYNWLNSNDKTPDLTESFKEITYYTTNLNGNEIRKELENKSYLSWSNMNIDGTSKYIDTTDGTIKRNFTLKKDSFYKLGCGPSNTDVEVTNPFYQRECNTR